MRTLSRLLIVALICIFFFTVCGNKQLSITAAGSTAFQPFAEKLAEQYMTNHPEIRITIQGGGSAVGIQSVLSGAALIGMADLVQLPQEAKALQATVVAKDGIVVVVHPTNPIANLSTDQIRDIFCGKIKTWQELGGAAAAITVVSREAGSGTRISFEQIIQNLALTRDAIIQDSNGTIRETVANDPNAIGYLSHGLINARIKAQTIDGVACSNEAIRNGQYKLSRPIYLLTKGTPSADVTGFIDYILSPEGQQTLSSSGLIPAK
jgi:phosphate transport system substrate-binding protein